MNLISLFIGLLSLCLSTYIFFAHDKKLKIQQKALNELALQKATTEEYTRKKAVISMNYERNDKLVITNKGMATAFDVKISSQIENDPLIGNYGNQLHWDSLKAGQEVRRTVALGRGDPWQITYDIYWRDDLGVHYDKQLVDYLE